MKLHHPARATNLVHKTLDDGTSNTSIHIEFLASEPKNVGQRSTPPLEPTEYNGRPNGNGTLRAPYTNSDGSADTTDGTPKTLEIPCDSIVICAGCWTPRVYRTLFPNAGRIPRVTALAGHSVVLKSKRWTPFAAQKLRKPAFRSQNSDGSTSSSSSRTPSLASSGSGTVTTSPALDTPPHPPLACHAVFTNDPAGYSPEIFSRLSGEVWLGGYNSSTIPLPPLPTAATQSPEALEVLTKTAKALCGRDVEVVRTGLCFRPVAPTGRPVIARIHEADLGDGVKVSGGVFVATGHGPWGISLSLGTGHVVSEMVIGREPSVDVKVLAKWEAQST